EARRGRRVRPHPQRLPLPRRAHGGARARRGRGLARLRRAPRARLRRPHPVRGRGPRLRVPEARGQPGAAHGGHPHELRRITVSSQIAHRPSRHSESGPGPARAGPGGAVPHPSATATVRFVSPAPEPRLVAHAAEQDLEVLLHACGAVPSRLFDTQVAAGFLGLSSPSLATLVERFVGVRLPKGDRLTDWTRRPLTTAQLAYAAADVTHLLEARQTIRRELEGRGRLTWAEDECRLLLTRVRQPQDPATAWWRMKDARSLRGQT